MLVAFLLTFCALKCVNAQECYYTYIEPVTNDTYNWDMMCLQGIMFSYELDNIYSYYYSH